MIDTTHRRAFRSQSATRAHFLAGAAALALSALMLSGCTSSTPGASEAIASTPSVTDAPAGPTLAPTSGPVAAAIVMSGAQLVSETATEEPIASVDFADGTDASVAFLTEALGTAPEVVTSEIDACSTVTARYSWGGTALVLDVWEPAGFVVTFSEPSVEGISLKSSGDFSVGDNAQAFFDALPAEQALDEYNDGSGPFVFDKVADASPWGESNAYGGVALMQPEGIVGRIVAPDTTRAFYC